MNSRPASELPFNPPAPTRRTRLVGVIYGVAVVLMFSGFTLVSRLGLGSSLKPTDIAALRFGVAGLLMTPVLLHFGMAQVRWRDAATLAFCGGVGFALFAYTGFWLAPASHGGVLMHGTLPLFTFLLAWMTASTALTGRRALGLVAILAGVIAMAWDSLSTSTARQLVGDGSLLLASASWAAYGLLALRLGLAPAHAASIVAVFSMVVFMPIYLALPGSDLARVPWPELAMQGLFQGALIGVLSLFIYTRAIAALGVAETALFAAAVPCVTTLFAALFLQELPSPMALGGVVSVTLGMIISIRNTNGTVSAGMHRQRR